MNKANFVKDMSSEFHGDAELFKIEPAWEFTDWSEETRIIEYIVVSATIVMFSGPETYIFEADSDGKIIDWGELPGSFQGSCDIDEALKNFEVIRP